MGIVLGAHPELPVVLGAELLEVFRDLVRGVEVADHGQERVGHALLLRAEVVGEHLAQLGGHFEEVPVETAGQQSGPLRHLGARVTDQVDDFLVGQGGMGEWTVGQWGSQNSECGVKG